MAKKKKTKKGGWGVFFSKKKKGRKRKGTPSFMTGLKITLTIVLLAVLIGGGAVVLIYMDKYVKTAAESEVPEGFIVFKNPPIWLNQEWKDSIEDILGSTTFPLNEGSAYKVSQKLAPVAWFKNVKVQTKPDHIAVYAEYRRPVGVVGSQKNKVYVGDDMVIMNYIPMTAVPVIEIKGASSKTPEPGQMWFAEDAKVAVELLEQLYKADLYFQQEKERRKNDRAELSSEKMPDKPLLNEIESIDVSNFAARKSKSPQKPQIFLNVKGGAKVYWGAPWGQATVHFEADEKDKLTRLYQFFTDHGNTLGGTAKYIELRWLENSIPRPR
ncbi:MAG: hypothetical protein ABFR90_11465 [Planctomycetota bacterium]